MWQTLFHIPNSVDAFGIHVPILKSADSPYGIGLLLFVVLLCGGIGLWNKYRQEGMSGDFRWALAIWAAICAVIVFIVPKLVDDVGLPIRGYGAMLLIAVVSAVALGMWRAAQVGANPEIVLAMMFPIFIGGLIGARGVYVAEYWNEQFKDASWWEILNLTQGGIVVYGALIGATIPYLWYLWRHKLPILPMCDIIVASLLLGQALGRLGCLCNGCCYGSVCQDPRHPNLPTIAFPFGSPAYRHQAEDGRLFVQGLKLEIDEHGHAVVQEVEPGSLAEQRGVQPGMRIQAIVVSPANKQEEGERLLRQLQMGGEVSPAQKSTGLNPTRNKAYGALFDADGRENHDRVAIALVGDAGPRVVSWPVAKAELPRSLPVQPTQIYEAFYAGLMALFAWLYFPFRRRDGEVFALMLTLFPISRFLMEYVRTDESRFVFGVMTISQAISVGLFLGSFAFWWWVRRQPRDSTLTRDDWATLNARWAAAA